MGAGSEVYLCDVAAGPVARACEAVRAGHHRLLAALRPKVALLTELQLDWAAREAAWDALTAFCAGPVRTQLSAADQALYAPACDSAETRLLVGALRATSAQLDDRIEALTRADEADAAARLAPVIESLLASHLAVEQRVLLPALATLPGVDLTVLVAHFTMLVDGSRPEQPAALAAAEPFPRMMFVKTSRR